MKLTRRNLPLNAMRAFEAAARHCHMRRAADELGVTHGALSQQVKRLEALLDVKLFDRSHNRLGLTNAGKRLLGSVTHALDTMVAGALYLDPNSMKGDLTIAATPSSSSAWLLNIIGSFGELYPEINIQLLSISPRTKDIDSQIDVAICYGKPDASNRTVQALYTENYLPVCNPKLLQSDPTIQHHQDLLQHTLLCDRHNTWPQWFNSVNIEYQQPKRQLLLKEPFLVLKAAKAGFGIALADKVEIYNELHTGQLVEIFPETISAEESYYVVYDDKQLSLRAQLFVDYVQQEIQKML
jgi:LysR family glycine cleavage system transcriptional activator